jgi:hypothetical protein
LNMYNAAMILGWRANIDMKPELIGVDSKGRVHFETKRNDRLLNMYNGKDFDLLSCHACHVSEVDGTGSDCEAKTVPSVAPTL